MATTSQRIKEALELRNMKQADLVEKTQINKGALSSYISGNYAPKQKNLYKIAQALDVNEAWLMGLEVPMERNSGGSPQETFLAYLNSLGYRLYKDDPEHRPFLISKNATVRLEYDTLDTLKLSIDAYTKATVDSEMLALKEEELKKERLEKERLIKHLQGKNSYDGSQFKKDWDSTHPEVNAARERTDIEVTDEMRKHDDDIMNDDSEWE